MCISINPLLATGHTPDLLEISCVRETLRNTPTLSKGHRTHRALTGTAKFSLRVLAECTFPGHKVKCFLLHVAKTEHWADETEPLQVCVEIMF